MKCVLCVLIDCPYFQGRVLYTVMNQVAGNTSGWDMWGLNFNIPQLTKAIELLMSPKAGSWMRKLGSVPMSR